MIRRGLVGVLLGALLVAGVSAVPAQAATNAITAGLTASAGAITVDLSGAQYATPPSWVRISALRNACTAAAPCWTLSDATLYLSTGFTGRYTLSGLKANSTYQVQIYADGAGGVFTGTATTPKSANAAPANPPVVTLTPDGLAFVVTAQAETDPSVMNDGGALAALRYNVDAYAGGKLLKRVLSKVAGGTTSTVRGLPRGTPITFVETDVNSVGQSPGTATAGAMQLSPTAPGVFAGTWQTTAARGAIQWGAPTPGAGRIAKYIVTVSSGTRTVFTKTTTAAVRAVAVTRLARKSSYTATITAVNSYGATTSVSGPLVTT